MPGAELEMNQAPPPSASSVAIRREEIGLQDRPEASNGCNILTGCVREAIYRGPYVEIWVDTGSLVFRSVVTPSVFSRMNLEPERNVYLSIPNSAVLPL